MVQNNKVLTVSYGTFSCTLEGFEDSFDTMKAIAEYFRDLAADDRYFGAEPPQPDAEMLARIAQREISRQVEARADNEGIHLRAAATAPVAAVAAAPAEAAQAEAPAPAPAPVQEEVVAVEPVAETPDTTEVPAPEVARAEAEEPVAEAPEVTEAALAVDQADLPEIAEDGAPEAVVEAVEEDLSSEAEEPAAGPEVAEAEAEDAPVAEDLTEEEDAAPEVNPAADSIAAKLQRIRDVVSRKAAPVDEAEFTEDQHAEGFVAEAARDIDETLNGDDDEDILASVRAEAAPEGVMSIEEAFATEEAVSEADDDAVDAELTEALELTPDMSADEDPEQPEEAPQPAIRVHKVKRARVEDALASGELEEVSDEAPEAEASSLSDEDEAALLRELAQVEAEFAGDTEETYVLSEADEYEDQEADENLFAEDAGFDDVEPQPRSEHNREAADSDISRLMEAAAAKLDDPETSSNRETFNQMRAAVAAAEAERQAGGNVDLQNDDEPYRADLASVVRPRRPEAGSTRAKRPERAQTPAPLKLVAEQRIDTPSENKGPIRPRRIRGPELETTSHEARDGGFATFAEKQGAVDLPELLEAAAAYLSFVEGHEQFSRPQLMNKVRQLETVTDFNREDGLRSFGQLLRDGKIEKAGSGRFTASGEIGFHPGSRAAG
jgi:hypothetical protein